MKQYIDALKHVMENGEDMSNRTGFDTRSVFGYQMRFNLQDGFPAVTTKKFAMKPMVSELLWFLEGSTDERRLAEILYEKPREELIGKTTIWTANAQNQGKALGYQNDDLVKELGPVYGSQWRNWNSDGFDQIQQIIHKLKNNPEDRRIILTAWNVSDIDEMALPPCHCFAQFRVTSLNQSEIQNTFFAKRGTFPIEQRRVIDKELNSEGRIKTKEDLQYLGLPTSKLSCQLYQRSVDMGLGLPFNIASYALLVHMLAKICNLEVGELIHTSGDMHIYCKHFDAINEQIQRVPFDLPTLEMPAFSTLEELLKTTDYKLLNYKHHDHIKMEMVV